MVPDFRQDDGAYGSNVKITVNLNMSQRLCVVKS